MLRGEIWLIDFEPAVGAEANKRRPAVTVSNNAANAVAAGSSNGTVTVVPLTCNIERTYSFQTLLPADETGLNYDSKAQAELLRSFSVRRFERRIGNVPVDQMHALEAAIKLHLELS